MHRMFETEISQDGEIRLPDEIRHDLGIENARKVIVLVDDGLLRIIPLRMSLDYRHLPQAPSAFLPMIRFARLRSCPAWLRTTSSFPTPVWPSSTRSSPSTT